jgi:hypothetical protein
MFARIFQSIVPSLGARGLALVPLLMGCCGTAGTPPRPPTAYLPAAVSSVGIGPPPIALGLNPFYQKYLDAGGVPVVGSRHVPDLALSLARDIVNVMLSKRADVRTALVGQHVRVAVMSRSEVTTHIPEHADLYEALPGVDWNLRARGLGATRERPVTSTAAENLLCSTDDPLRGQNTLVHELAHTIHEMGLAVAEPGFVHELEDAYAAARAAGKWDRTYAGSNVREYWADGVLAFYDVRIAADPPDGVHSPIHLREQLREYDPALYRLITRVFAEDGWRPPCPPPTPVTLARAPRPGAVPPEPADVMTCSPTTGVRARLVVMNRRTEPVDLLWLSYDCREKRYDRIAPGGQSVQETFDHHRWRIRDAATGALLLEAEATAGSNSEVVVH